MINYPIFFLKKLKFIQLSIKKKRGKILIKFFYSEKNVDATLNVKIKLVEISVSLFKTKNDTISIVCTDSRKSYFFI
jgi:hypothetical protein